MIIERSEMDHHGRNTTEFVSCRYMVYTKWDIVQREEIHVPTRSRTSSLGADPNEGFLNPVCVV